MYYLVALILLSILVLYGIASSNIAVVYKFILGAIEMGVVGAILQKKIKPTSEYKLEGEWGLNLLKTRKGLVLIERIAKSKEIWNFLADVGLFICYGFFSFIIMRKHLNMKKIIIGIILLTVISLFVAPYSVQSLITMIKGQAIPVESVEKISSNELYPYISLAINYGFGLFGVIFAGLVQSGIFIIEKIIGVLMGTAQITQQDAGVTLIIPGMNLPLFEGIIALFIILLVHEGAHAVLGKIAKVPLHSTGLVFFGIIPIGAFVEPDEGYLKKIDREKQTRVLAGGPVANFYTAIIFFILFLGFVNLTGEYRETGMLVVTGLEQETIIYSIDGADATQNITLEANTAVMLETNLGEIEKVTDSNGKLGVAGYYLEKNSPIIRYKFGFMNFIYVTLGLIFSLNFVIGAVNLLPIPVFDGNRILEINIRHKRIVSIIGLIAIASLLLNFIPWLF